MLEESGLFETNAHFMKFCEGLKNNSILLALDDFGTGYSNFHYLHDLSPNTIKIDRSFTLKALQSKHEYNLLRHMVDMSHDMELKLCIEGIETAEELEKRCEMNEIILPCGIIFSATSGEYFLQIVFITVLLISDLPAPDLPCPSSPSWSVPPKIRLPFPFRCGNPPLTVDYPESPVQWSRAARPRH